MDDAQLLVDIEGITSFTEPTTSPKVPTTSPKVQIIPVTSPAIPPRVGEQTSPVSHLNKEAILEVADEPIDADSDADYKNRVNSVSEATPL